MNLPVLAQAPALTVVQQKEWTEIVTGWETTNRYEVRDPNGMPVMYAGEVGGGVGSFLSRSFLKSARPFKMEVRDTAGQVVLHIDRPFTFFFSRVELRDGSMQPVGEIRQRFKFLGRRYTIHDASGAEVAEIQGPLFKPWTFNLMTAQGPAGKISKQWSGLLKEAFTDADTFGVEFGPSLPPHVRLLLLGATFLIDFVHFEQR